VVLKLILETSQLDPDQIISVCKMAKSEGFDFVKTSTGFNGPGATIENVQLMRYAVGPDMGVKASGGVKTLQDCLDMIAVGASRIGTSSGVAIMKEELIAVNGAAHAGDEVTNQDGGY
jgi:deoxyribose-phosphate aldolase